MAVAERPTWGPPPPPESTQPVSEPVLAVQTPAVPKPPNNFAIAWNRFLVFLHDLPELMRRITDAVINIAVVGGAVVLVAGLSVAGDRLYLQYTDTGTSKFEAFLRSRGYYELATAFRRQNEICQDSMNELGLCQIAAYSYLHPDMDFWPDKTKTANALPSAKINVPKE